MHPAVHGLHASCSAWPACILLVHGQHASCSSGGYGSSDEADPDFSLRFCTNCTAPLDGVVCLVRPGTESLACRYESGLQACVWPAGVRI